MREGAARLKVELWCEVEEPSVTKAVDRSFESVSDTWDFKVCTQMFAGHLPIKMNASLTLLCNSCCRDSLTDWSAKWGFRNIRGSNHAEHTTLLSIVPSLLEINRFLRMKETANLRSSKIQNTSLHCFYYSAPFKIKSQKVIENVKNNITEKGNRWDDHSWTTQNQKVQTTPRTLIQAPHASSPMCDWHHAAS